MSKTHGYYLTVTMKDLIASIMVNEDRVEIGKDELYDTFLKTSHKMKKNGVCGRVAYSREDLAEFKQQYENEFDVGVNYIRLRDGYSIEWLQDHIVSYMSADILKLLGLISYEKELSR